MPAGPRTDAIRWDGGPGDTIRPRVDAAGADVHRVDLIQAVTDVDRETNKPTTRMVSLKRDLKAVSELVRPDTRLLLIDPISAYLNGANSHNNSEMRSLLAPLAKLAVRSGLAIVGITHLNKGGGNSSALYRTSGSLAFVAAARAVFLVTKDRDDPSRRLAVPVKNNIAPDSTGVAYSVIEAENGSPVLAWEPDPVTITADEAMSTESDEVRSERGDAKEWLASELVGRPRKVQVLKHRANQANAGWVSPFETPTIGKRARYDRRDLNYRRLPKA